jgi:SAM-dependent methyltransferase
MPLLRSPAIKAIYGAEPCLGLHKAIQNKALAEGLSSKYHLLPCSVASSELLPALEAAGTGVADAHKANGTGIFDAIICVRVLCSVPQLERTTRELYALLKPGGRVLVMEHVVNPWRTAKGSIAARIAQGVYQAFGWSYFIGDCCLDRDVEGALRGAADEDGGWESVQIDRSFEWSVMPHISGVLVKKSR